MPSIKMLTTACGPDFNFQAGKEYHGVDKKLADALSKAKPPACEIIGEDPAPVVEPAPVERVEEPAPVERVEEPKHVSGKRAKKFNPAKKADK